MYNSSYETHLEERKNLLQPLNHSQESVVFENIDENDVYESSFYEFVDQHEWVGKNNFYKSDIDEDMEDQVDENTHGTPEKDPNFKK